MDIQEILAALVAIPSLPGTPNGRITGYLRATLERSGIGCTVLPGPEGDRANLFATIGPRDVPGYVLSGHSDVVPVAGQAWSTDPFRLTAQGERLLGRGTTDMKGFLACMLAMAPEFAALPLRRPIHLAFSYDEEIGCRGVGHMIARLPDLCAPPLGCIVGEPSALRPVLSHKGKQAVEVTLTGRAGHSSDPGLGVNALYPAAELLLAIRDRAAELAAAGPFDPRFAPPHSTVQAGVIRGGAAVNIIPDRAVVEMEVRAIPGQPAEAVIQGLLDRLAGIAAAAGVGTELRELSSYPALPPPEDPALGALLSALTGQAAVASVSYGTEAGLFHAAGIPSIICGPGDIARAHRPDEFILMAELEACRAMMRALGERLCAD